MKNKTAIRHRVDRKGAIVPDERRLGATVDTNDYRSGDRLFAPKKSSPARYRFRSNGKSGTL